MKPICTVLNPFNDVVSIDIFDPSRGVSGTLSYPVKVNNSMAFFEMNDNGDWVASSNQILFSRQIVNLVNDLLFTEEKKRLQLIMAINNAMSVAQL